MSVGMDKLQLAGQNLGRVFNSRSCCVCDMQLSCFEAKLPNLMLKTWPKQLIGSLPLDIALPAVGEKILALVCLMLSVTVSNCHASLNIEEPLIEIVKYILKIFKNIFVKSTPNFATRGRFQP